MAAIRLLLSFFIVVLAIKGSSAQSDLHRYDDAIRIYYNSTNADSFMYYMNLKMKAARAADSLELWGNMQGYVVQYFGDSSHLLRSIFERIDRERWRQPLNQAEWLPFFDLEATKAYYLWKAGRVWESVQAFERADSIFQIYQFPDRDITEYVYKTLSNNYTRLGDNEKALAIHQKALDFSIRVDSVKTLPFLYCNIGITYWNNKNYNASENYLRKGLALPGVQGLAKASLLSALATTLLSTGRQKEAMEHARASIQLLKKPADNDGWIIASSASATLASVMIAESKPDKALSLLKNARLYAQKGHLESTDRMFGKIGNKVAEAWLCKREPLKALSAANTALTAILPGFMPTGFSDNPAESLFYQEVTIAEALQVKARAFEMLYQQKKDNQYLIKGLECLDLAWKVNRMVRENFIYQSSKLSIQDDLRQWDEMSLRCCRLLFDATGDFNWANRAFDLVERNKSAILLDALKENLALQRLATNDSRFVEIDRLRQNIALLERELLLYPDAESNKNTKLQADVLRTKVAGLEAEIRKRYPSLTAQMPGMPDLSDKNALHPGELLIEYFTGKDVLEVFVRNAAGQIICWKQVALDDTLVQLLNTFESFFKDANAIAADPAAYFQTAFDLWLKLIPQEATAAARIVIAPDGFVGLIPFEALVTAGPSPQITLRNAPYLIKSQTVRYAWSLSTLYWQQALAPSGKGLLGVAPGFRQAERGLSPLLTGGKEWQNAGNATALLGRQATSDGFSSQAMRYAVLHLATHAQAGETPRIEFLDEPLYLSDIYALRLQAELIVLSACETGTGVESKGEGVMSLSRAFACAGARSLIGSLWKANDESAAAIFSDFYQNLSQHLLKSDALRNAKLHYLESERPMVTKSPWYWAAFSFSGADGAVELSGKLAFQWWWAAIAALLIVSLLYFYFSKRND